MLKYVLRLDYVPLKIFKQLTYLMVQANGERRLPVLPTRNESSDSINSYTRREKSTKQGNVIAKGTLRAGPAKKPVLDRSWTFRTATSEQAAIYAKSPPSDGQAIIDTIEAFRRARAKRAFNGKAKASIGSLNNGDAEGTEDLHPTEDRQRKGPPELLKHFRSASDVLTKKGLSSWRHAKSVDRRKGDIEGRHSNVATEEEDDQEVSYSHPYGFAYSPTDHEPGYA